MVDTGWMYPTLVINKNARSPHWTGLDSVEENPLWSGCSNGSSASGHPHATVSMANAATSDDILGYDYNFNIPLNARIDGITAVILRSGGLIEDTLVTLRVNGNTLQNKAIWGYRSDGLLINTSYGSATDKWGSSLLPVDINSSNFGLQANLKNYSGASASAWLFVLGLKANYTNPTYSLTSNLPSLALLGTQISYQITLTNTNSIDNQIGIPITVPIPAGFTLVSATSDDGIYDSVSGIWTPKINHTTHKATLNLVLTASVSGNQTQTVTETEFNTTITNSCNIVSSDPGAIYSTDAPITDPITLSNLIDGEIYTISAYSKVVDTHITGIFSGVKNNRLSVVNGSEVIGSRVTAQSVYQRVSSTFRYNASQSLTLRLYGQYQSVSTLGQDEWAGFTLKQGYDDTYDPIVNLFADPEALLDSSTTTTITLPANSESAIYDYLFDTIPEQIGANPFWTGIQLTIDVQNRINSSIEVQLKSSNGNDSEVKSKSFTTDNTQIIFGGQFDLWGLISEDITLQDLIVELLISNISLSQQTFTYSNITLTLFWQNDETYGQLGFSYNGTHSRNYNLYMNTPTDPEGPERDIGILSLPQMDGVLLTNQILNSKSISIDFLVWGDTLEDARNRLDIINAWLQNSRNDLSIPIPQSLIFDYNPDKQYMAVLSGSIDVTVNYTTLECTATFMIPSGVATSTEPTETGPIGANSGIVKVRPIITVLSDGSATLNVTDVSGQEVTVNHQFTSGDVITIDSETRTVVNQNGTDFSTSVDVNSIWFNFLNDYDLSCTGGIIQGVSYYEGF